ncbi:hypothetical protein B0H12DRAFT_1100373, partial [Mycena haematopus]
DLSSGTYPGIFSACYIRPQTYASLTFPIVLCLLVHKQVLGWQASIRSARLTWVFLV